MKIRITCKTPDCLDDAIEEAISNERGIEEIPNEEDEGELDQKEELHAICSRWVRYGEYVTIEIDTEKNTAVVLERDEDV